MFHNLKAKIVYSCSRNQTEANPNKFKVIYSHDADSDSFTIKIGGSLIKGEPPCEMFQGAIYM